MLNPSETVGAVVQAGRAKAALGLRPHAILAALAGAYIGFGAILALRVTGNLDPALGNVIKLLFGLAFPVGLLLVLMAGASLFTGDVMYMTGSFAAGGSSAGRSLRVLSVSYLGNFLGSVLIAFLAVESGVFMDQGPDGSLPLAETAIALANSKCSLGFQAAFLRGIVCNWLVCLAIFMSLRAADGVSKAILMWPPITAFVAMGMEHSVANMCFVPLGLFLGGTEAAAQAGLALTADWGSFLFRNLLPVTLGNILGGALFVALPYLWLAPPGKA
ncbi:MAG: formate/nitrite transporter family protein [Deltaproteobacteria bacterium]|nr:formate/nitrite transporter family protein [Deltaproteobacteria bacterium]